MRSAPKRELSHGVLLTVAYDGTDFAGWQAQPGRRTVQGTLAGAVGELAPHHSAVRGASRTDAGVHAEGQVCAFACDRDIPPRGWLHALNALLPDDVAVRQAAACDPGTNPRFLARGKLYRYTIRVGETRDPLLRHRAWFVGPSLARPDVPRAERGPAAERWLDLGAMRDAAGHLVGTHDFRAFRAAGDGRDNTVRTLHDVRLRTGGDEAPYLLHVEFEGTAFLKQMVRILVGTLVDVGRGRIAPSAVPSLLGPEAHRSQAGLTAPPQGLTLVRVELR